MRNRSFNDERFNGRSLVGANFRKANLQGKDFRGCDLRSTDFRGSDLTGARFEGAQMGRSIAWRVAVAVGGFLAAAAASFVAIMLLVASTVAALYQEGNERTIAVAAVISTIATLGFIACFGFRKQGLFWSLAAVGVALGLATGVGAIVAGTNGVVLAVWVAFAVAVAGAVAVAFFEGLFAVVFAVFVAVGLVDSIASLFPVVFAALHPEPYTYRVGVLGATLPLALFRSYVSGRVRVADRRFALVTATRNAARAIGGTRFQGSNLADTSFAGAHIAGADLTDARLVRVDWRSVRGLDECIHNNEVLAQSAVRELLVTRTGANRSYERMDLHDADLTDCDLRGANLKEANCTGAIFRGATLTGSCIESWNIDATTRLEGVECKYVYLLKHPDSLGNRKRRPADPERCFESDEFGHLYSKVLDEMEILLKKGLSQGAMRGAFEELREKHPEVSVKKFEDRGSHILLGLGVATTTSESDLERTLVNSWEMRFRIAEAEKQQLAAHNHELGKITLAAMAAGFNIQVGDQYMQDRSIHTKGPLTIKGSQVTTLTGNSADSTQTMRTRGGGESPHDLAVALERLLQLIVETKELSALESLGARQQVEMIATAANDPTKEESRSLVRKAFEKLTLLLSKLPDATRLIEATTKAWEAVSKGGGA